MPGARLPGHMAGVLYREAYARDITDYPVRRRQSLRVSLDEVVQSQGSGGVDDLDEVVGVGGVVAVPVGVDDQV